MKFQLSILDIWNFNKKLSIIRQLLKKDFFSLFFKGCDYILKQKLDIILFESTPNIEVYYIIFPKNKNKKMKRKKREERKYMEKRKEKRKGEGKNNKKK